MRGQTSNVTSKKTESVDVDNGKEGWQLETPVAFVKFQSLPSSSRPAKTHCSALGASHLFFCKSTVSTLPSTFNALGGHCPQESLLWTNGSMFTEHHPSSYCFQLLKVSFWFLFAFRVSFSFSGALFLPWMSIWWIFAFYLCLSLYTSHCLLKGLLKFPFTNSISWSTYVYLHMDMEDQCIACISYIV